MRWYITTDINSCIEKGGLGGLGHMYFNYITSQIIALIFEMQHVYYPFKTAGTTKHRKEKSDEVLNWDSYLNLKKGEIRYDSLKCKRVYLPTLKPFKSYTLQHLKAFFSKHNKNEDILFIVRNSNRVYINEFYNWCENNLVKKCLYENLLHIMREKCIYKSKIEKGLIVLHIRRGDASRTPLSYYKNVLDTEILKKDFNGRIVILSLGTAKQMEAIKKFFSYIDNVDFKLNYDTIKSFELMMDCETLICGESTFPKVAGLYSQNKKYYLPLIKGNRNMLGRNIENYGKNWILKSIK